MAQLDRAGIPVMADGRAFSALSADEQGRVIAAFQQAHARGGMGQENLGDKKNDIRGAGIGAGAMIAAFDGAIAGGPARIVVEKREDGQLINKETNQAINVTYQGEGNDAQAVDAETGALLVDATGKPFTKGGIDFASIASSTTLKLQGAGLKFSGNEAIDYLVKGKVVGAELVRFNP